MTSDTTRTHVGFTADGVGVIERRIVMRGRAVATRAEHRVFHLQHGHAVRAMHIVAVGTVFRYRFVRMDKRATFAGVARVARVVYRFAFQKLFVARGGAVRVVTGDAVHLAREQWVRGRLKEAGLLFAMARDAKCGARFRVESNVGIVLGVARHTTHLRALVR